MRSTFLVLVVVPSLVAAGPEGSPPPLNKAVLEYARSRLGETVGDGQCTSLAVEALGQAGARRFPFAESGDYVWGRPVESFAEALPGDVLQFRDAVFVGTVTLSGGRTMTYRQNYPHHTAIVAEVREGGRLVTVLHQNVADAGVKPSEIQTVREGTIRPPWLQKGGRVWIYRPTIPDDSVLKRRPRP
ncbi:MAG: CHAP domain-containing protein [Isosphaeraceae bacterium]